MPTPRVRRLVDLVGNKFPTSSSKHYRLFIISALRAKKEIPARCDDQLTGIMQLSWCRGAESNHRLKDFQALKQGRATNNIKHLTWTTLQK
jgi:hypothetical protein